MIVSTHTHKRLIALQSKALPCLIHMGQLHFQCLTAIAVVKWQMSPHIHDSYEQVCLAIQLAGRVWGAFYDHCGKQWLIILITGWVDFIGGVFSFNPTWMFLGQT